MPPLFRSMFMLAVILAAAAQQLIAAKSQAAPPPASTPLSWQDFQQTVQHGQGSGGWDNYRRLVNDPARRDRILAAARGRQQALNAFDLTYEIRRQTFGADAAASARQIRLAWLNSVIYVEQRSNAPLSVYRGIFNGPVAREFHSLQNSSGLGFIAAASPASREHLLNSPVAAAMLLNSSRDLKKSWPRRDLVAFLSDPEAVIVPSSEASPQVALGLPPHIVVTLDASRGYTPTEIVEYEIEQKSDAVLIAQNVVRRCRLKDFQDCGSGIFLPRDVVDESYAPDHAANGKATERVHITVRSLSVNSAVKAPPFEEAFPAGAKVVNHLTGENYVATSGSPVEGAAVVRDAFNATAGSKGTSVLAGLRGQLFTIAFGVIGVVMLIVMTLRRLSAARKANE